MTTYISQKLTPEVYALFLTVKAARVAAQNKRVKFFEVTGDALLALQEKESSVDTVEALRRDLQKAREHIDHIAMWCSQSVAGFTNRGVADAVMRMCDDYHVETQQETK